MSNIDVTALGLDALGDGANRVIRALFATAKSEIEALQRGTGVTDGSAAAAGSIGELISSSIGPGGAVPLTTGTDTMVTSIMLTAGDWDVWGSVGFAVTATTFNNAAGWIGQGAAAVGPPMPNNGALARFNGGNLLTTTIFPVGTKPLNLSATTQVYLGAWGAFSGGTVSAHGFIGARRRR